MSCIFNVYFFKVFILYILDCYNLIFIGYFLENEGGGGGMMNFKIVYIMFFYIIIIVKCFIECL